MISKKTVFVLGAGASKPFGFPTGFQLREEICSLIRIRSNASILLEEHGYLPDTGFGNFLNAFLKSGLNSIDAFLSRNTHFAESGRAAIAACLMSKEDPSVLFGAEGKVGNSDWYGLLWNCLVDQIVDIKELRAKNDVSFITFNYESSLEAFLQQAAMSSFSISADAASEVCKQLEIHHMYGSFGYFDWKDDSTYGMPDDAYERGKKLRTAAEGIKVVPAQRHEAVDSVAHELLSEAQQIVFLGFGFDATNCARLGLPDVLINSPSAGGRRSVFMTAMGMTDSEVARAANLIKGPEVVLAEAISVCYTPCIEALRRWGILLS